MFSMEPLTQALHLGSDAIQFIVYLGRLFAIELSFRISDVTCRTGISEAG